MLIKSIYNDITDNEKILYNKDVAKKFIFPQINKLFIAFNTNDLLIKIVYYCKSTKFK